MLRMVVLAAVVACVYGSVIPAGLIRVPVNGDDRIVGGQDANIADLPYQLSMIYWGSHRCGASIISSTWAVSAAHCTVNVDTSGMQFRAGSSIQGSGGQVTQVRQIINHPQYNAATSNFDLNVMQFDSLSFQSGVQAISLPSAGQGTGAGSIAAISGWGALYEGGGSPSNLQVIWVPVLDNGHCNSLYGGAITDQMICAGLVEGGQDACQGDSGGPMAVNGQLIGATSWGNGCARPNFPGVYARVASMRGFISQHTGI